MEQNKGFFPLDGGPVPESTQTEIVENGIRYLVDFENGQKTGFFLDQKYNRQAVARLSRGKRVLDCFTHTGSFGLNAAKGGAAHVRCVDISESAVDMARENACPEPGSSTGWTLRRQMCLTFSPLCPAAPKVTTIL